MKAPVFLITTLYMVMLIINPLYSEEKMPFTLTSPNFKHLNAIPKKYTCEGEDISPALEWQGVPKGTMSLVLIVDDPDAPDPKAPRMTWVHWVLYNIPPETTGLKGGISATDLPNGTKEGINDSKEKGYGGPCPPIGQHRYFFKLYALDKVLKVPDQFVKKSQLEIEMKEHILEETQLIGTYEKLH